MAPVSTSSFTAAARACICSVLSWARWRASPTSDISSPRPVVASPIRTCASAAEYCAFTTSFWVRNDSTFADSRRSWSIRFCCCCSSCGDLRVEPLQLALDQRLSLERRSREVLAVPGERLTGLTVELHDALLELRGLELKPLLRSDDVGHPALDLLEHLELLLVAVVEGLPRILGLVEHRVRLDLEQGRETRHETGHESLLESA